MTTLTRTVKRLWMVAAAAGMAWAMPAARATIVETYIGDGTLQTEGSAAQTARNQFLARLFPGFTTNVFNVNALQDNDNCTTLTFANYMAGTGAYSANVGSVMRAELNKGSGFIFYSGNGFNLAGSGLTGSWGTTMAAENRYPTASPAITANRGGYIGIAPITGTSGSYTFVGGYTAFGVSIGRNAVPSQGPIELSFFDANGNYVGYQHLDWSGLSDNRAYVGVISDEPLGAVILGGPGFIAGYEEMAAGFHTFDFGIAVPEPSTLLLIGVGGAALWAARRPKRK